MQQFTDPRLAPLNGDSGLVDGGMRAALQDALEPTECAVASYSVSAHIWFEAVLTDRALLLVKGAVRAKVTRVPLPITVSRAPSGSKSGVRIQTPLGKKTLWSSKLDPEGALLLAAATSGTVKHEDIPTLGGRSATTRRPDRGNAERQSPRVVTPRPGADTTGRRQSVGSEANATRPTRAEARKAAGPRPRKPRRQRVRKQRVGFAPSSTIWDMADNCVKCGRPLTDPRSRQARVGTKCIRIYGSQQRRIPNPAHSLWLTKKTKAEVDYIDEKVRAEAEFARAKEAYEAAKAEWLRVRARGW